MGSALEPMDTEEIKGLLIFTGLVSAYLFVILGCLERRLKSLDRVILKIEDDNKYVN